MFVPVNAQLWKESRFRLPETTLGKSARVPGVRQLFPRLLRHKRRLHQLHQNLFRSIDEPAPAPKTKQSRPRRSQYPNRRRNHLVRQHVASCWYSCWGLLSRLWLPQITVGALKRKTGLLTNADWKTFNAPDGSCSVELLGTS